MQRPLRAKRKFAGAACVYLPLRVRKGIEPLELVARELALHRPVWIQIRPSSFEETNLAHLVMGISFLGETNFFSSCQKE